MQKNDDAEEPVAEPVNDETRAQTSAQTALSTQSTEEPLNVTEFVPSSDDPIGTRIIYVIVAMVVVMFIVALGFLYEVARHRPN